MKKLIINIHIHFLEAKIRSIRSKWANLFNHWNANYSAAAFQMAESKEISKVENKINKLKSAL